MRAAIREGRLTPGATVPSTRTLASQLGVARGTVVEAYAQLAAEGWLRTSQGAPTKVAPSVWLPHPRLTPARKQAPSVQTRLVPRGAGPVDLPDVQVDGGDAQSGR